MRTGFSTLAEALDAPEGEIDNQLSDEAFDAWCLLLSQLEKNPERLTASLTAPIDQEHIAEVRRSIAASKDDAITERIQHANRPAQCKSTSEEKALNPLPKSELTTRLLDLESEANASLSILADHNESALIAERFPSLTVVLDDIEEAFVGLFSCYANRPSKALLYARLYFPNAFLVFISNAASNDFDGDAFWKNLFEKIGVESQASQNEIKRAYYHGVKDKGLPHFTAEDTAVTVQTVSQNCSITFSNMFEAKAFAEKARDAVTGTTVVDRGLNMAKGAFNVVDDALGIDTRETIKGVMQDGIKGALWNGLGRKKQQHYSKQVYNGTQKDKGYCDRRSDRNCRISIRSNTQ